jgi:EAL domain-containing protein (putative c-di-GMP-specific phosphodiesterase class I)
MSDVDIPAGARWQTDIAHELDAADFGIICVTPENMDKPWLMFEAGALSKSMKASRVCPLAYSMELNQLSGPIGQFQANRLDKDGVLQVLKAINSAMADKCLDSAHLLEQFEMLWGRMEALLNSIPSHSPPVAEEEPEQPFSSRDTDEIMKFLHRVVARNESIFPPPVQDPGSYVAEAMSIYSGVLPELRYAPISTLEGAIVAVEAIPTSRHNIGQIVSAICSDLDLWHRSGASIPVVSVNLSAKGVLSEDYLDHLRLLGEKYPNGIAINLSESQLSNVKDAPVLVRRYRESGFLVGIKGFGTGYSSLSLLKELQLNTVWIDKSFIRDLPNNLNDRSIVRAIVSLAERLGFGVIAEGVSSPEQSKILLDLGVKMIAGSMAGDSMSSADVYARIST